jgi:pseudouridine-5'-phosphate glycosidase
VPGPAEDAMPTDVVEIAVAQALREAAHVRGAEVTPFLLGALERATGGQSLRTNVALLKNNARVAAEIAVAIADHRPPRIRRVNG